MMRFSFISGCIEFLKSIEVSEQHISDRPSIRICYSSALERPGAIHDNETEKE
jgi:hypothetical protein